MWNKRFRYVVLALSVTLVYGSGYFCANELLSIGMFALGCVGLFFCMRKNLKVIP